MEMVKKDKQILCSNELLEVIYDFKARCYANGKEPPSITKITIIIAKNINKERMWQNEINEV